jgi:hypothetical protein
MGGSFKISRLFGIDVEIHWAFFLLVAFFTLLGFLSCSTPKAAPESNPDTAPATDAVRVATGVLERQGFTSYMYGTHTITDASSGIRYALRSEDEELLDSHAGQIVTVHGTLVPGYENGQIEGGPPLLEVTRVEPVQGSFKRGGHGDVRAQDPRRGTQQWRSSLRPELSVVWSSRTQTSAGRSWVFVEFVMPTGKDLGA